MKPPHLLHFVDKASSRTCPQSRQMRFFGVLGLPRPCDLGIAVGPAYITSIFAAKPHLGQKADMRRPSRRLIGMSACRRLEVVCVEHRPEAIFFES